MLSDLPWKASAISKLSFPFTRFSHFPSLLIFQVIFGSGLEVKKWQPEVVSKTINSKCSPRSVFLWLFFPTKVTTFHYMERWKRSLLLVVQEAERTALNRIKNGEASRSKRMLWTAERFKKQTNNKAQWLNAGPNNFFKRASSLLSQLIHSVETYPKYSVGLKAFWPCIFVARTS